jgi:membrane-associated phospholipid phosphatase
LRSLPVPRQRLLTTITALLVVVAGVSTFGVAFDDVTEHDGLAATDAAHLRFFIEHRSGTLVDLSKFVTQFGTATILAVLSVIAAVVLWWRGARVVVAVAPALALAVAGTTTAVLKPVVGRARPPLALRLVSETEPSFPSGHAADGTAFYVCLALVVAVFVLRRPLARVATVVVGGLWAGSIATTRLVLGVHWPSDVLAGCALGTTVAVVIVGVTARMVRVTPPDEGQRVRRHLFRVLHAERTARSTPTLPAD